MTLAHLCFQLVAIIKITGLMLLTEEQPVFTGVAACAALLQETAEGRNASTRCQNADGCATIDRYTKIIIALHKDRLDDVLRAIRKKCCSDTYANFIPLMITRIVDGRHGQVIFVC